jgi:hypothetical protein
MLIRARSLHHLPVLNQENPLATITVRIVKHGPNPQTLRSPLADTDPFFARLLYRFDTESTGASQDSWPEF